MNFDYATGENTITHNPDWPDHPYTILYLEALDQEKQMRYLIYYAIKQILIKYTNRQNSYMK